MGVRLVAVYYVYKSYVRLALGISTAYH
jgi:hypothetical protein